MKRTFAYLMLLASLEILISGCNDSSENNIRNHYEVSNKKLDSLNRSYLSKIKELENLIKTTEQHYTQEIDSLNKIVDKLILKTAVSCYWCGRKTTNPQKHYHWTEHFDCSEKCKRECERSRPGSTYSGTII